MAYAASTTSGSNPLYLPGQLQNPAPKSPLLSNPQPVLTNAASTTSGNTSFTAPALSLGNKAVSPTSNLSAPNYTLPKNQTAPSSMYAIPGETYAQYEARMGFPSSGSGSSGSGSTASNPPAPVAPVAPIGTGTASTPAPQNPDVGNPSNGLLYQLIQQLQQKGQAPSEDYTKAQQLANQYNQALQQSRTNEAQGLAANALNPIPLEFQQGRGQVLQSQYAAEQAALGAGFQGASNLLGAANTQQQLQQGALGTAAGLAMPQLAGYNQQSFNPVTGQFSGGANLGGVVNDVAARVKNGTMTYNDGLSALSSYGQAGVNALLQALGPNFNVAQSNTLAGQQGSIGPAYNFAMTALTNLQSVASKYGVGNIPALNSVGNWVAQTFGVNSDQYRQYQQAIAEARNAYSQLLASSQGGTPSAYTSQANAAIPDNATPNDIQAAINSLESLGQKKLDIYGNPGVTTPNSGSGGGGGSIFNW